ncbi:MAG: aspartate aminotransferase family protein, partial [Alphaproteobacteria bacterium]
MSSNSRSAELYQRVAAKVPAGVSSNTRSRQPHPLYFSRAQGALAFDADGNRHLDLIMGNGAVMLGHGYEPVRASVARAVEQGLTCGFESVAMVEAAEIFMSTVQWPDMVRFTNTGTEAAQHALHLARHATGRTRIGKVEGSYHGWSDEVFVSVFSDLSKAGTVDAISPLSQFAGQRQDLVDEVVVVPFNDIERTLAVLDRVGGDLAALLLEPVMIDIGFIPADIDYLQALRAAADKHGFVLIYDELLTGFNLAPGGVADASGVAPDLALFGKAIANGYPLAALAGREELMRMTEPGKGPAFVGTFNGHGISVAAAASTLPVLATGEVQKTLAKRGRRLAESFARAAEGAGVAAQLVTGGSHLHWYFLEGEVKDYRAAAATDAAAYSAFTAELATRDILFLPNPLSHHAISLAHDDAVLDEIEAAFE